jgi:hypothetical protein
METTIWKYEIEVTDRFIVNMPVGAKLLAVQTQGGTPYVWAQVDPTARNEARKLCIHGTGHPIGHDYPFLGTFQLHGGALVFHVFDGGRA